MAGTRMNCGTHLIMRVITVAVSKSWNDDNKKSADKEQTQ